MDYLKNLELIKDLSAESKDEIANQNKHLIEVAGAEITVDSVINNTVNLSVKNINGKRTGKYELFDFTYKLFSDKLTDAYRVIVKV